MGLVWHTALHRFQCLRCEISFSAADAVGHIKSKHNTRRIHFDQQEWEEYCRGLPVDALPLLPTPLGPPVERIHIRDGFACRVQTHEGLACDYAVADLRSMQKHVMRHPAPIRTPHVPAKIQTLSSNTYKIYVEVIPGLASLDVDDPMAGVKAHLVAFLPAPTIFRPNRSDQRPLLLERTNWDGALEGVRESPEHRIEVARLLKAASESEPALVRLGRVVNLAYQRSNEASKQDPHGITASYILKNGQEGYNIHVL